MAKKPKKGDIDYLYYGKPEKDSWVRDVAGTTKALDKKLKAQGVSESDVAGFKRYMTYRSANQEIENRGAARAVSTFQKDHTESLRKQQEQQAKLEEKKAKQEKRTKIVNNVKESAVKALDETLNFLDRPFDAFRTGVNEGLHGRNVLKGAWEGLAEKKKNTSGVDISRSLGFDPKNDPKDAVIANMLGLSVANSSGFHHKKGTDLNKLGDEALGQGIEMLADPTLLAGGSTLKIAKLLGKGRTVEQVAEELKIPVEVVQREFVKGTHPGQEIVDPNVPKLDAPKEDPLRFLNGPTAKPTETLGLNEPLYKRSVEGLGKDVQIDGTPLLNAPNKHYDIQPHELDQVHQEMDSTFKRRQAHEDEFVKSEMAPYDDMLGRSANADHEWNTSVKQAKEMSDRIKKSYGKISVPEGNWADWGHEVPVQFRANRGTNEAGIDLYTFADQEGFSSVDEAVQFLKNIDQTSKTRLKDLKPADDMKISPDQYQELENAARRKFQDTDTAKGLDAYFNELNQMVKGYQEPAATADPLSFMQPKNFKVKQEPVSYVGKMDPKDMSTVRSEGSYSTRYKETPTGDTLEINPAKPLEFKTQAESRPFKTTIEKEITRKDLAEVFSDSVKPTKAENPKSATSDFEAKSDLGVSDTVNDIKSFQKYTKNIYEVASKLPGELSKFVTSSLDVAKQKYVTQLAKETNDLKTVVKGLKIKKGSKESALVQVYGEKSLAKRYLRKQGIDPSTLSADEINRINLEQLQKTTPKWEKIVDADNFFREKYDSLISQVNDVRSQIYPNNPEKLVPIRDDYYHHFNELDGFEGLKNLFDSPANVESPATIHSNSKFQGFMQKRGTGKYKKDAVGGFLKYIRAASHSINIDPVIPVLRKTAKELDSKTAKNLQDALVLHADDLAGNINPVDKRILGSFNNTTAWKVATWVNNRVRTNTVLGNLGTVVAQVGNLPQGIGKAKWSSVEGLASTMKQTTKEIFRAKKTDPIYQSTFIKERYGDAMFSQFDQRLIDQPKKMAVWMMETVDKQVSKFVWNSMYAQAKQKGVKDTIKYADYETRKLIAGRGVGEVPLLQKSKVYQMMAPFTLEVNNQWKVLSEMVGKKDAAGLITTLVASYGLNQIAEEVRGNGGVAYDPIGAIVEGYASKDGGGVGKALGSLAGETIGNIGGGNMVLNMANTDAKVPGTSTKYSDLFGDRNPNRFGSGLVMSKALADPLYLAAPFGANQIRKSTKGLDALLSGGVYKGDDGIIPFTGPKKELKYSVSSDGLDAVKTAAFGPSASADAHTYFNAKSQLPLNETQTKLYELMKKKDIDLYQFYRQSNVKPYEKAKVTKVAKENISSSEKAKKIEQILDGLAMK